MSQCTILRCNSGVGNRMINWQIITQSYGRMLFIITSIVTKISFIDEHAREDNYELWSEHFEIHLEQKSKCITSIPLTCHVYPSVQTVPTEQTKYTGQGHWPCSSKSSLNAKLSEASARCSRTLTDIRGVGLLLTMGVNKFHKSQKQYVAVEQGDMTLK